MEGAASPGHSGLLCGPHLCRELWHLNLTLASALELLVASASTLPLEPLQELGLICRSGVGAAQVHLALWLGQIINLSVLHMYNGDYNNTCLYCYETEKRF